ncbi:MAG: hypothetical protein FWD05_12415 [Oscillospiraceae bacterium]|nr:hypothetical protein [Oscillospiraceae bacterium]
MEMNNKTNPDYMLRRAMQRTESLSPELISKVRYNTLKERPAVQKFYRSRRIGVVAAAVAVMMLMFGTAAIAANVFGLRDLFISNPDLPDLVITFDEFQGTQDEFKAMSPDGTLDDFTIPMDKMLLAGFAGSPEFEAAMEWINRGVYVDGVEVRWDEETRVFVTVETGEFFADEIIIVDCQECCINGIPPEFLEGHAIIIVSDRDIIPEVYQWYGASSWSDVDKIHEIIERHGLVLYGELFDYWNENRSWNEFQESVANEPFIDNSDDNFTLHPGYRWESGTFQFEAQYDDIWFVLRSSRKGVFDTVIISNLDIDDFSDEWAFENRYGTPLILTQSANMSFIIADTETAFIVVTIHAGTQSSVDYWRGTTQHATRSDLEDFADLIDFRQLK